MNHNHNRHSIRLKNYDYAQPGAYFITICTHNRKYLFGDVVNKNMQLNKFGEIVNQCWVETEKIRPGVIIDEYIIMPNHLHGIIVITNDYQNADSYNNVGAYCDVGAYCNTPLHDTSQRCNTPLQSPSKTIGAIVRGFKSSSTKQINQIRNTPGIPIWQRNYYEHIIRDDESLQRIREYIVQNPAKWEKDKENTDIVQVQNIEPKQSENTNEDNR